MPDYRRKSNGPRGFRKSFGKPQENRAPEVLELRVEKMVQGGEGMARLEDGRVCFVSGALPGELCKVQLTFKKKDFTKGRVVQILEESPDRVKPLCPLYGKCGGCSLQHLNSEKQIQYMEQVERENFRRLAHAELPVDFKIHTGNPWNYRNRARVVCRSRGNKIPGAKVRFGFREQESNDLVFFDHCPVLTNGLNDFLKGPAQSIFESKDGTPRELDINIFDNGAGQISYYYRGMPASNFAKNAISVVDVCGKNIEADASVFFQSNLGLLPELVNAVRSAVDDCLKSNASSNEWLIDLFSGVGFFAAILQDRFKKITTVEREEGCLSHAKINLSKNVGDRCAVVENISAPAEEWLAENVVDVPATLIVDPPRTGLPKEALEAIVASSVNCLIYVSCDPVTLARDYAKFAQAGFSLTRAEGFAFYPQTPHLEMMFVLNRERC